MRIGFLVRIIFLWDGVCLWKLVNCQNENGIMFAPELQPSIISPPTAWLPNCACYPIEYCKSLANANFDPRIVSSLVCYPGYQICCPPRNIDVAKSEICGNRSGISPRTNNLLAQASYGEYPWMGSILDEANMYLGGSVLISASYALTAAHKIVNFNNIKIRFGVVDSQKIENARDYNVVNAIIHPNFDKATLKNDLAVLRLKEKVEFSSAIGLACLPENQNLIIDPWTYCWVSGWGKDGFNGGMYQTVLKSIEIPVIEKRLCQKQLQTTRLGNTFEFDDNSFICAGGYNNLDACTGDGGSPLVCELTTGQWTVVGLVAWGIECGQPGIPGVYVNLAEYLPWIEKQITT